MGTLKSGRRRITFCRPKDETILKGDYLYYFLTSRTGQQVVQSIIAGSAQPKFNKTDLRSLDIPVPPLPDQIEIGCILGTLDNKLDLNRRVNETLEAMARAIFKDWFVDFGPTRAKIEGRAPYLAPEIWKLFPDRLDAEGKPELWSFDRVEAIADLNWGDTNTTKESYSADGYTAFSASGPDGLLPYYDYDRPGIVLSAIGANCGMTWLARGKWSCIKNTIRLWPKNENLPIEYLFLATYGADFWPRRGSAQPFISQGDARNIKLLVPKYEVLTAFGNTVLPAFQQSDAFRAEDKTLAGLRDLLLPKLMSGEIQIREADKIAEAAL